MTSPHPLGPSTGPIARTPDAVRAALPPGWRAEFEQQWAAALREARTSYSLAGVHGVIDDYWALASALADPATTEAVERARRWLAGTAAGIPADDVLGRP